MLKLCCRNGLRMNCFRILISSCEFWSSSKENFYNSLILVCKLDSRVFFFFFFHCKFIGQTNVILELWLSMIIRFFYHYSGYFSFLEPHHWWPNWSNTRWWWFHFGGNDLKCNHFAWVAKKWIGLIPPILSEAKRFYIALDLVEVPNWNLKNF